MQIRDQTTESRSRKRRKRRSTGKSLNRNLTLRLLGIRDLNWNRNIGRARSSVEHFVVRDRRLFEIGVPVDYLEHVCSRRGKKCNRNEVRFTKQTLHVIVAKADLKIRRIRSRGHRQWNDGKSGVALRTAS